MNSTKILKVQPLGFLWDTQEPFLFCAHHRDEFPKGKENMEISPEELKGRQIGQDFIKKNGFRMYHGTRFPGFPYHPHRGFETISINKEGFVDHSDSLGGAGRFGPDDVQWMTAGKGIQHSEMFPLLNKDSGNTAEIFQVWLNLPKANKFVEPHFKMLWKDMIPVVKEIDEKGKSVEINVIAGTLNDVKAAEPTPDSWAADPNNGVSIQTIKMDSYASYKLPAATIDGVHRTLYFYRGKSIKLDGQQVGEYNLIQLKPNEDILLENGDVDGYLLLLQAKPIGEPIAQHGPFVMNTQAEIHEAFSDYQRTQFGGWPWPKKEQVHDKSLGRFARHVDGREEYR